MLEYLATMETADDRTRFESLYLAYRGLMYHVAYHILKNPQDAEDAVHQSFVKLAEHMATIPDGPCPRTRNLVDWLGQYTADNAEEGTESFKRSFLGRMLFSGDDVYKPVKVLSGGEKVRCMLSRMMLFGSNALVLDQPTNHLDLESITAVNNGLIDFKGVVLFASHDHEFVQTIANRVMEFVDGKLIDKMCTYDAYIAGAREEMLARLNG